MKNTIGFWSSLILVGVYTANHMTPTFSVVLGTFWVLVALLHFTASTRE
jgi:hypothetical protein